MPQALLPLVSEDATRISDFISVVRQDGQWFYFCGTKPVFQHPEGDLRSFRMFTAQLCVHGVCKQAEIIKAFGVSKSSVLRSVNTYRQESVEGFYRPRRTRGAPVMTPEVIQQAQQLFEEGHPKAEVARELDIAYDTLRKAIDQGRLELPGSPADHQEDAGQPPVPSTTVAAAAPSDKSSRSNEDRAAGEEMGVACTRPIERVLASLGKLPGGAPTRFESCRDVSYGGVLCALPALAENGLFRHLQATFPTLTGYYTTLHVILLLAYTALCRIRTVEQLQYESPGELGKLMGLDRVPEVRWWVRDSMWMREVRKLTSSGHQTSLISTAYGREGLQDAVALFSRWCQENFFRYMMEHYALDALSEYQTEEILETKRPVVNPAWRELARQSRSAKGKLTQRQARFAALTLKSEANEAKTTEWEKQKSDLREQIEQFEHEVDSLKEQMDSTPKHLEWHEFPEDAKFERLAPSRKRLTDTVKLVAYRAETAMSNLLRESLRREDDSRSLLRDLLRSDADVIPQSDTKVLEVQIHTLANPRFNRAIQHLLDHLNAAECTYPGMEFRLNYTLGEPENGVTSNSARDQES